MTGRTFGSQYELEEPVGRGATGQVWRGRRLATGEPVAVKVLRSELADDPDVVSRFVQERALLTGLRHPRLVAVEDLVVEAGTAGIVMEWLPGGDLRRLVVAGPLPPGRALALTADVCEALAVIHGAGIVHRDIKPENVLLDAEGHARLADLGIARLVTGRTLTRLSGMAGTPEFLAPEVAEGDRAEPPADVYGAGVLLFELLCGRPPFVADSPLAILRQHAEQPPPRPRGVDADVWAVLSSMLAKHPDARPDATTAAGRLRPLAAALVDAPPLDGTVDEVAAAQRVPVERETVVGRRLAAASPDPGATTAAVEAEGGGRRWPWLAAAGALAAIMALVAALVLPGDGTTPGGDIASGDATSTTTTPGDQQAADVATLALEPAELLLGVGQAAVVAVSATDAEGSPVEAGALAGLVWSSADTEVAVVDGAGRVVARQPGRTTITAALGEVRAALGVAVVKEGATTTEAPVTTAPTVRPTTTTERQNTSTTQTPTTVAVAAPGAARSVVVTDVAVAASDPNGVPSRLRVSLSWAAPASGDAPTGYRIHCMLMVDGSPYAGSSDAPCKGGAQLATVGAVTSATVEVGRVEPGPFTWIRYEVQPYNSAGASAATVARVTVPNLVGFKSWVAYPLGRAAGVAVHGGRDPGCGSDAEAVCRQSIASGTTVDGGSRMELTQP